MVNVNELSTYGHQPVGALFIEVSMSDDIISALGNTKRSFSTNEVAAAFGVTGRTVLKWIHEGKLEAISLPHKGRQNWALWHRIRPSHIAAMCEVSQTEVPVVLQKAEIVRRAQRMLEASDSIEILDPEGLRAVLVSIL